ncbi:hypothetical protein ACFL11_01390 [Patescibacteria group bacterium]
MAGRMCYCCGEIIVGRDFLQCKNGQREKYLELRKAHLRACLPLSFNDGEDIESNMLSLREKLLQKIKEIVESEVNPRMIDKEEKIAFLCEELLREVQKRITSGEKRSSFWEISFLAGKLYIDYSKKVLWVYLSQKGNGIYSEENFARARIGILPFVMAGSYESRLYVCYYCPKCAEDLNRECSVCKSELVEIR